MIVSENQLRDVIRLMVLKEAFEVDTYSRARVGGKEGGSSSSGECEIKTQTTLPLNKEKTRIKESEITNLLIKV